MRCLAALAGGLLACGGDEPAGPGNPPAAIAIVDGEGQVAPAHSTLPILPSVLVTDGAGEPVPGVRVTFSITQGTGTVSDPVVRTDDRGIAHPAAWRLGDVAGTNQLRATVAGAGSVTFTAVGLAGPPVSLVAVSNTEQAAAVGSPVPVSPSVRVEDQFGNGVGGVSVAFTVTAGGGTVTGDTVTTDVTGIATVGSWSVGPVAGVNTLVATIVEPGITPATVAFQATAAASVYLIEVRFLTSVSNAQRQAFLGAAARLEQLIASEVPDITVNLSADACVAGQPPLNGERIDDLVIFAEVAPIDGVGAILGRAGPCIIRGGSSLPAVGVMQFDSADLTSLEASGALALVILHEMMHVLGFGTIWQAQNLLVGADSADPIFTGTNAVQAFRAVGGDAYPGRPVPVENTGAPGTRDAHWRESVFTSELMTGFLNPGANPLSRVTAAQFQDLGYTVNLSVADPFTLGAPPIPGVRAADLIPLMDDTWEGPLYRLSPDGVLERVFFP